MRAVCLIFPSMVACMRLCVCVCLRKKECVGAHLYMCMIEIPQSVKKVTEEWVQERQTAKQHQISYFHSWAARRGKKKQSGPTFSTPAYTLKGLV